MRRIILATLAISAVAPIESQADQLPRHDHVLVIMAENHAFDQVVDRTWANINALAKSYGLATNYYGVVHPSRANYIAMIGGDTFGIHDDDAWYCTRETPHRYCPSRLKLDPYVDHTIDKRSLVDQLEERKLTWKGYYESIPSPRSKVIFFPDVQSAVPGQPFQLYDAKHNAFLSFKAVQTGPKLADKIVGFDQLFLDLERTACPTTLTSYPISATTCTDCPVRMCPRGQEGHSIVAEIAQRRLSRRPFRK
jgi:phosphatidylinositol-3-phosphatase